MYHKKKSKNTRVKPLPKGPTQRYTYVHVYS